MTPRYRSSSSVRFQNVAVVAVVVVAGVTTACDVPTPLAPAEPIGEVPRWGEGFATPQQAPNSMLGPMMGGGEEGGSGGAAPLGPDGKPLKSPGDTGSWTGGDAALGKGLYVAMCARCHGQSGEGGTLPDGAKATAFADARWQAGIEDRMIARTVMLGKGAMPSFMQQGLDKPKLMGVVAYIRTLKPQ